MDSITKRTREIEEKYKRTGLYGALILDFLPRKTKKSLKVASLAVIYATFAGISTNCIYKEFIREPEEQRASCQTLLETLTQSSH